MGNRDTAFLQPIKDGLIRIYLNISEIECEVENDAPDFVYPEKDHPVLKFMPELDLSHITDAFNKSYVLQAKEVPSKDGKIILEMEDGGIWFDLEIEKVKDIWLTEYNYTVESEKPRYLNYFIKNVNNNIEWLQTDPKTGEIRSLSKVKKKYQLPLMNQRQTFSGSDILMCADMISRAAKKIDVRIGSAMVKFNIDKHELEPLLLSMAEKLGYTVKALESETIATEKKKGNNVSHVICLS